MFFFFIIVYMICACMCEYRHMLAIDMGVAVRGQPGVCPQPLPVWDLPLLPSSLHAPRELLCSFGGLLSLPLISLQTLWGCCPRLLCGFWRLRLRSSHLGFTHRAISTVLWLDFRDTKGWFYSLENSWGCQDAMWRRARKDRTEGCSRTRSKSVTDAGGS